MSLLKVDELKTPPVVGETYLVPCVLSHASKYLPVLGSYHADPEFGDDRYHLHLDCRFMTQEEIANHIGETNRNPIKTIILGTFIYPPVYSAEEFDAVKKNSPVTYRPKVCQQRWNGEDGWSAPIEHLFIDKELDCKKCPHRGFDLSSFTPDKEGNVVCPGHGLKWNLETKKLVKRFSKAEEMIKRYLELGLDKKTQTFKLRLFTNNLVDVHLQERIKFEYLDDSFYEDITDKSTIVFHSKRPYIAVEAQFIFSKRPVSFRGFTVESSICEEPIFYFYSQTDFETNYLVSVAMSINENYYQNVPKEERKSEERNESPCFS